MSDQSIPLDQTNMLQPVTSWPDVAKSYGIGLVRGAIEMGALPGDTKQMIYSMLPTPPHDFPTAAGHYANLVNALLGARSALELPTSPGIQQAVENRTGQFYQPQTPAGQTAENAGRHTPQFLMGLGGIRAGNDAMRQLFR
jgi:hypothetical protein